jgi:hypothetical protein
MEFSVPCCHRGATVHSSMQLIVLNEDKEVRFEIMKTDSD